LTPGRIVPCFSTLGCPELDLEDVLLLAVARGIPAVELRTLGGTIDLPAYFEARYGTPDRLRDCLAGFDVRIASLDSSVRIIGAGPKDCGELLALVPWAIAAGAPRLRVFDGGEGGDAAELASIRPTLGWWRDLDLPLQLMTETHDALAHPAALQDFIDTYPDATVLWDTYHTWKTGGEHPSVTWRRLGDRAPHLHVKDSIGVGGYVAPGAGDFPFADLIGALRSSDFDGTISLEWERHWFPELPPIAAALDGFQSILARWADDRVVKGVER
jgi:sugar phosphate isomerase/epimerase